MEKLRENEKINEKVKSQGRPQYIDVNVPGGILRATACIDPNYPGIDIEFIPDKNGNPEALSLPRILFEKSVEDEKLRAIIWGDEMQEDPTLKVAFFQNQD